MVVLSVRSFVIIVTVPSLLGADHQHSCHQFLHRSTPCAAEPQGEPAALSAQCRTTGIRDGR